MAPITVQIALSGYFLLLNDICIWSYPLLTCSGRPFVALTRDLLYSRIAILGSAMLYVSSVEAKSRGWLAGEVTSRSS